ncbi:MAG: S8 family serine peptidase [Ignavibacteriales bacterium]|nr:S8 family serine peptidase [Ignavibacteriales bacterium]
MNIIATCDFVNHDPNVANQGDMGEGSHGTATLSIIGGFKEGQLVGPAYASNFILAKTENTDSETPVEEDNWIAGLEWADSIGVDVTSTSLSYLDYDSPFTSYTWQDMDGNTALITIAADLAAGKGIVVVNAASNNGLNTSHNTLGAPADGDSVFTIGAVTSSGTRSSFSSVGPTFDGRFKPDLMAMGSNVYHASSFGNSYSAGSGTSFSCPLAAGVCALIIQKIRLLLLWKYCSY